MLLLSSALAAEITVDAGEDWCSALQHAEPGDEVILTLGEHLEGTCTLGVEDITLTGQGATLSSDATTLTVAADGAWIEGITFRGEGDGVLVRADGVTVRACQFLDLGGTALRADEVSVSGLSVDVTDFRRGQGPALVAGCEDGSCQSMGLSLTHGRVDSQERGFVLREGSFASIEGFIHDGELEIAGSDEEPTEIVQTLVVGASSLGRSEVRSTVFVGEVALADGSFVGNTVYGALEASSDTRLEANAALSLPAHSSLDVLCDEACFNDAASWDFRPTSLLEGTPATATDFCGDPQDMLGALALGEPLPMDNYAPKCPDGGGDSDSLPFPSDVETGDSDSTPDFDPFYDYDDPVREAEPTCGCAAGGSGALFVLLGLGLFLRRRR